MREGLLWYDADPRRPTSQKIEDAARRYQERFGRAPNCCHLHPDERVGPTSLQVVPNPRILLHHYWVGVDETLPAPRVARKTPALRANPKREVVDESPPPRPARKAHALRASLQREPMEEAPPLPPARKPAARAERRRAGAA